MEDLHRERGIRIFVFQDDDLYMRGPYRTWIEDFLDELHSRDLADRILWRISCRIDDLVPDLILKLKAAGLASVYHDTEEGLPVEEGAETAGRLARLGIDAIEISAGVATKPVPSRSNIRSIEQEAYFLPYAKAVRPKVGRLPLSLVGGLRSPQLMQEIVAAGWTDFVSLARPFICEPDLVNKIRTGRWDPVSCTRDDRCRVGIGKEGLRCRRDEEPAG